MPVIYKNNKRDTGEFRPPFLPPPAEAETNKYDSFADLVYKPKELKNKPMDSNVMIESIMKTEGGTPAQYRKLMDEIAYHETGGRMDPAIHQIGGGPGRGVYQFEEGKDAGGKLAVIHTKKYLEQNKIPVPSWIKELDKNESVDFSKLTKDQQDILFLGHYKMHAKADFSKIMNGTESNVDFWGKYHQTKNDPVLKQQFLNNADRYSAKVNKDKMSTLKKGGIIYNK
jgi:hypothetical protein